jgi:hypothetical protein
MMSSSKVQISGSLGPNVVVQTDRSTLINIAGGKCTGDVYREVGRSDPPGFKGARDFISKQDFIPEAKTQLNAIVDKIQDELAKGPEVNVGLIQLILERTLEISPDVLRLLAQAVADASNDSALRGAALEFLSKTPAQSQAQPQSNGA